MKVLPFAAFQYYGWTQYCLSPAGHAQGFSFSPQSNREIIARPEPAAGAGERGDWWCEAWSKRGHFPLHYSHVQVKNTYHIRVPAVNSLCKSLLLILPRPRIGTWVSSATGSESSCRSSLWRLRRCSRHSVA